MKHLQTKHEKNAAKITTLIMLIFTLCLFVVGQDYKEEPEEYGVAINFGSPAALGGNVQPNNVEEPQEEEPEEAVEEEIIEEEQVEEEVVEEEVEEEEIEKDTVDEEALEEEKKEAEEAEKKALEEEKILKEEAELAEKLKKEEEAKEKAEAEAKSAKLAKEKAEKEAKAKAKKQAEAAKRAKAVADAKAKAAADAKAKADAKAAADAKAKADALAAGKANNTQGGSGAVAFSLIENVPIYPGCEGGDNSAKKKCMNIKIKQFIAENFNTELASELTGIQKINIAFKINTTGNVVGVRVKASDPKLEDEAKRVTSLLPKMKPGIQQGRPVVVNYGLPIKIELK